MKINSKGLFLSNYLKRKKFFESLKSDCELFKDGQTSSGDFK